MWRSLLFVPALNERLVSSAAKRGADAIVLDLEAAVPAEHKREARARLSTAVPALRSSGSTIAVRINLPGECATEDIIAACRAGAELIVLPMATPASTAQLATEVAAAGGTDIPLIALIETPRGVIESLAIAEASSAVVGLGFGIEDYAREMGAPPSTELLAPAAHQIIQSARAASCEPLVLPDTFADYQDLERFKATVKTARAMGATGSFAIHPSQIEVLHDGFTPTSDEIEVAHRTIEAAEQARKLGQAVASLDGVMIDAPVEARARAVITRAERLRRRL